MCSLIVHDAASVAAVWLCFEFDALLLHLILVSKLMWINPWRAFSLLIHSWMEMANSRSDFTTATAALILSRFLSLRIYTYIFSAFVCIFFFLFIYLFIPSSLARCPPSHFRALHISLTVYMLANFIFLVDNFNFTVLIWRRMLNLLICHLMNARLHNAYEHVHYREPVSWAQVSMCWCVYFNSVWSSTWDMQYCCRCRYCCCCWFGFFFFCYFAPAIQEKLANATGENQLKRQRTNKQMKEMKYTRSYINVYFKADWMQPVRRTISNEKTSTGRTEERHTHKKHTIPQQQHANLPTI